jgi:phage terminase small subunit
MRITPKQQAFALAYIELQNCSAAYRTAYNTANMKPKTVHEAASRLLKNSKVAARIAELKAPAIVAAGLSVERTLLEIARVAYADPRRFYRADGTLKDPVEWDDDMAAAVAQVEIDVHTDQVSTEGKTTTVRRIRPTKLKFWDKNAAIDKAMRHLGAYERDNTQRSENLSLQVVLVGAPTNERE